MAPLTRRHALAALGGAAVAAAAPAGAFAASEPRLLGSAVNASGAFRVGVLDEALRQSDGAATPVRMHALCPRPDGREAVAVGRRPGDLAFVLDGRGATIRSTFRASDGRRFSGHGAFSADGRAFLSAEIDAATGDGFVVVRDVAGSYAQTAECRSAGIGPHELVPFRRLVAVANGAKEPKSEPGIRALGTTHARSNLALVDPATGAAELVVEPEGDLATLSLRHLVTTPDGGVLIAAQDTEAGAKDRPLVARLVGERLRWLDVDDALSSRFAGSVGTLAVDASGRFAAASGPKGGVVVGFDLARDRAVGLVPLLDCCGVAPDAKAGRFVATNGLGDVVRIAVEEDGVAIVDRRPGALRWDNHLALLPANARRS